MTARALVLTGFGINCDYETAAAFNRSGGSAERVHLNDLLNEPERLGDYHILAVPGGFSFGDDIASGRVLANRLRYRLGDTLLEFVANGNLVIGICNGFQVLVKMGLLPLFENSLKQDLTLTHNDSARFEDRWVALLRDDSCHSVWLGDIEQFELPIRHGEGKFVVGNKTTLKKLADNGQIALRYAGRKGAPAEGRYPENPNGSVDDIAAICDPSGRVFGLMPHPEAYVCRTNHPRWTREDIPEEGSGLQIFRNAVSYVEDNLLDPLPK
jgi:phosphoribosylformylglycinamidine synthase subunit PurQ / glutaminase